MADKPSEIKEILDIASPVTRDAIYILSTSSILTDAIAERLLVQAGIAKGNTFEIVHELKSYPIWYMRTQNSWVLDDDVREYAFVHLNGNTKQVQKSTLTSLKELRGEASNDLAFRDQKDLEYQIARLGLRIEEEQEQSINTLRYFHETAEQFQVQETSRVVDLYLGEGIAFQDQAEGLPEYIQSAYFMRGKYAYGNGDFKKALRLLSVVVNNISESYQSISDSAISYHLIGHIWAEDERKSEQAEKAYRQSLVLLEKINETFERAQVYDSLGNLLSKDRGRASEAEQAYRQSIALRGRNDTVGLAQVHHSLGSLLRQDQKRAYEAEVSTKTEVFGYSYNIHNILKIASMFELAELVYFRVPALITEPDIRIRLESRRKKDHRRTAGTPRRSSDNIHYAESLGRYGFEVTISNKTPVEIAVSPLLSYSRHVLYTNVVEPILRWSFVRKGYAFVHAACVSFDGQAVLVTAQTDTGKTSTILRTVDNYACSFLSDDMTIISRDGRVMSYPKPVTISNHTLSAVNANSSLTWWERIALQFQSRLHSKSGRKIGLNLSKFNLPVATMNAIVQMIVPPPKYMVHRLIPKATYANYATLSRAVIIERGDEFLEALQHQQAVETFLRNAEDAYDFPPYPILAKSLSQWNGEDLHPQEQAIVDEALKAIPTIRLRDPKFNWWQRLEVISPSSRVGVLSPQYKRS